MIPIQFELATNESLRGKGLKSSVKCSLTGNWYDIQDTAKHAQWLSEIILFYYQDHGLTEEQAYELSRQLKLLAIQITHVNSLHDLKFIYAVITMFNDQISVFRHQKREFCIGHSIRHKILDKLNTCIATGNNFKTREELMHKQAS